MRFRPAVECAFFDFPISELPPFGEQIGKTVHARPSVPSGGYDVLQMADREFESEEVFPARARDFPNKRGRMVRVRPKRKCHTHADEMVWTFSNY